MDKEAQYGQEKLSDKLGAVQLQAKHEQAGKGQTFFLPMAIREGIYCR